MEDPGSGSGSGSSSDSDEECMVGGEPVSGSDSVTPRPRSLLDVLKPATKSTLARKRKREHTARKKVASSHTDPKKIKPEVRVKEFPGEFLEVRKGKLFCVACREEVSLKKSTVKNHIYSGIKHKNSKKRLAEKEARERDLSSYLQKQDKEEPAAATMVSMEERIYRIRVVEKFLSAGVPLSKIDRLRGLLEENGLRLTNSTHLYDYIPLLLKQEKEKIRTEVAGTVVSAIFDGTTRFREALAICLRFVRDGKLEQRLVRLMLLARVMN